MPEGDTQSRRANAVFAAVFAAALLGHFFLTVQNWKCTFLPGHEFRQAQTAIIAYYIDKQNNFSPDYEAPILGKPWVGFILEFPLYQWAVVGLSRAADLPHHVAARAVSLASFYLALPAIWLLLARLGAPPARRFFALTLLVLAPAYIFYSRAFLIDPMTWMLGAWFLLGFVRTMERRSWGWLALTVVTGMAAIVVKSVLFMVWVLPAAGYGLWLLWCDAAAARDGRAALRTALWGAATIAPALLAFRAWIAHTDPMKAAHPSAYIFTSTNLSLGNWGLFNPKAMFGADTWRDMLRCWEQAILPPAVLLLALGLAWLAAGRWRAWVAALAGLFLLPQLLVPYAYAWQDYYYYSCAMFGLAALGLGLPGLLETRLPAWVGAVVLAAVPAAQLWAYWRDYRPLQVVDAWGGFPYTQVLQEATPENTVMVMAGADWAAMHPLYAERRALMIRRGLEHDHAYLERAFHDLADEEVAAFVVAEETRFNRPLIERAAKAFGFDPRSPTYSHGPTDVYIKRIYAPAVRHRIRTSLSYQMITVHPAPPEEGPEQPFDITPAMARAAFPMVTPGPHRAYFEFGYDRSTAANGREVLGAHPNAELRVRAPAAGTQIVWEFEFNRNAYEKEGEKTDGVDFIVAGETPDGQTREVYRRWLDPRNRPEDRGTIREEIPYTPRPGEILRFISHPHGSKAFDWVAWYRIEVR